MAEQDISKQIPQKRKSSNFSKDLQLHGKVQPQAVPLEEAVLGAIMIDSSTLDIVMDILSPNSFYVDSNAEIFRAVVDLYEKSEPVDILTVVECLKKMGKLELAGGAYRIASLTNKVASAANAEYHARIVSQKHIQRELIKVSTDIITEAYEDKTDVFELLDTAEQNLFKVAEENLKQQGKSVASLLNSQLKEIEERMQQDNALTGVPSGFTNIDRLTGGWQRSDLIILAARPGMGKTSFTLALARNAAVDFDMPVAFFSLEMSAGQLVQRLMSMESELSGDKMRKGTLEPHEWTQLTAKIDTLRKAEIHIDDTPGLNVFEMRAKCRRLKSKHDIQMIVIDYLQLMSGASQTGKSSGNREQEISQISRSLKGLAKEINVPIIALSQLSRAVETRGGEKRPMLSDLRESGAIEQDADMVLFIYRAEYYKKFEDEDGRDTRGLAEIIFAKNRHGATETAMTRFISNYAKFMDYDDGTMQDPLASDNNVLTFSSKMNDNAQQPPKNDPFANYNPDDEDTPF